MKKRILFFSSFLVIAFMAIIMMPNNVFAAVPDGMSDEVKSELNLNEDWQLVINDTCLDGEFVTIMYYLEEINSDTNGYKYECESLNVGVTPNVAVIKQVDLTPENNVLNSYTVEVIFEEIFSDNFKLLTTDGNIVINDTSVAGNYHTLVDYLNSINIADGYYFSVGVFENENYEKGTISLMKRMQDGYSDLRVESHIVNVTYDEKFGETFNKVAPNGDMTVTFSSISDKASLVAIYISSFGTDEYDFEIQYLNDDCTSGTLQIWRSYENGDGSYYSLLEEQHIVNIKYEVKVSDKFKSFIPNNQIIITSSTLGEKSELVDEYVSNLETEEIGFSVWDYNEDYTKCSIQMYKKIPDQYGGYDHIILEQHLVNVSYDEKYSETFKKFSSDGKILFTSTSLFGISSLIDDYCSLVSTDDFWFMCNYFNDEETQCVISMYEQVEKEHYIDSVLVEQHVINVSCEEKITDEFKSYLNDKGELVLKLVKPEDLDVCGLTFESLYRRYDSEFILKWNDDFTEADLIINPGEKNQEGHPVKLVYSYDETVKNMVDEIVKAFPENQEYFMVKDMEIINYWLNGGNKSGNDEFESGRGLENYSGELKQYFDYKNFNLLAETRMGMDDSFVTVRGGNVLLQHNGTTYWANDQIAVKANHILYVPDDTAVTKDALLAAIQKRVDEYAGEGKVKIVAGEGTIEDYYKNIPNIKIPELQNKIKAEKAKANPDKELIMWYEGELEWYQNGGYDEYYEDYISIELNNPDGEYAFLKSAEGGFWFTAVVNGENYQFIVVKDSKSMINPTHKTVDLNTNVQISTTSTSVPLDTLLNAKKLTNVDADYEEVVKILKEKATEAGKVDANETYDLKLYSNSLGENITKLNDGTFEVKLPTPEKFKGKNADDLKVYYVDQNDNDKIYTYDVKFEDNGNYIVFITDHFSIYTLSEKLAFNTVNDGEEGDKPITGGNAGSGEADPEGDDADKNDGNDVTTGGSSDGDKNNGDTPQTGDNVLLFVGLVLVSVVGIAVSVKVRSRK